ncbi:MAG: hypothetical protein ACQ9IQ_15190 [Nitrospirales bacterium]
MTSLQTTHHFLRGLVWILLIVGSSIPLIAEADQHEEVTISLERTIHFLNNQDTDIVVPPGCYTIHADQPKELLVLHTENGEPWIQIKAQSIRHEEPIPTATPLSFSEEEDEHRILLLQSDGTGLETVGSYSGIHSRAARQIASKTRVIRKYLRRIPLQPSSEFTLHIPVQLQNVSPDIDQLKIRCWAHVGNDATKYDLRIGEGEAVASVSNRQYQGTVAVRFNANSGKEAQDADRYYCGILFHKPGIGFRQPGKFGTPLGNQKPAWLVSEENTPFRIHAQGGLN